VCGATKPVEAFSPSLAAKRHPSSRCRDCQNAEWRARRAADPTKRHPDRWQKDAAGELVSKRCARCARMLPASEYGFRQKAAGLRHSACKACLRLENRDRYWANPEAGRARAMAEQRRNRDRHIARLRAYRVANEARLLEWGRAYNKANRAARLAYSRRYNEVNREARRAYGRNNPDKAVEGAARYRARKAASPEVGWVRRHAIITRDGRACYLCGAVLKWRAVVLDHVWPLSRGGKHVDANLRVACALCNARKGARRLSELDPAEFPLLAAGC